MFSWLFGEDGGDISLADRSWRTSVLLSQLLEVEGNSPDAIELLSDKSMKWMLSSNAEKQTVGLNTLRFLFRGKHLAYTQDLLDKVLDVFFSGDSLPSKLAALDFLGAMRTTPNPLSRISVEDEKQLLKFRSKLMKRMNTSQHAYSANGVHVDIARETSAQTHLDALKSIISEVDNGTRN